MDIEKFRKKRPNPRQGANPINVATFCYTLPTFVEGYKKELEIHDLYETFTEHKSGKLGDKVEAGWRKEVENATRAKRQPSLRRVLIKTFGLEFLMYGIVLALSEIFIRVTQPILLGQLVAYYMLEQEQISERDAYLYAAGVVGCSLIIVFVTHPYMMGVLHVGMKMRVACCSLIYRKALKLNKTALGQTTVGQIVNLLSNDVNRFDVAVLFAHQLWVGPLETLVVTYFMYQEVGISAVLGMVFLLSFIPVQFFLGKKAATFRLRTALRTDERVRLMNEIISGIQVIKMYTWEKPFAKLVAFARRYEIKSLRLTAYIRACVLSFIMFTTRLSLFVTILAYVLFGNEIDAKKVFVLTGFYNVVRQSMTVYFPQGIAQIAEANVSIKRLNKFLLYEETLFSNEGSKKGEKNVDKPSSYGSMSKAIPSNMYTKNTHDEAIYMQYATAKWTESSTDNTFTNFNLKIKRGSLVAVIGPVGSGKTSLLHAILKELPLIVGQLEVNGTVSYASQEPWLFPGNVRQNILFGQPLEKLRYKTVVRRCALERDFSLFPYGDRTIVGERGVSLSGGQRARINLARAVYKEADIYLLDDPLSAVDTHVGKELFEKCIMGYLKDKTVILITHQLQYLKDADHIIILDNGIMKAEGSYHELQASGLDFAKLLNKEEEAEEEDEDLEDKDAELVELTRRASILQRANSIASSLEEEKTVEQPQEVEEQRTSGSVSGFIYKAYFTAGANCCCIFLLALLYIMTQFFASLADYFLTYWVNLEQQRSEASNYHNLKKMQSDSTNHTVYVSDSIFAMGKPSNDTTTLSDEFAAQNFTIPVSDSIWFFSRETCVYIYTGIAVAIIVVTLTRSFAFFTLCMRSSVRLHDNMFNSITRASMRFFNTNSSGRILNRFSKDMGAVDELLPAAMIDAVQIGLGLGGIIIVVAIVNYWLMIPTFLTVFIFFGLRSFYLTSSRSIKRLEGITRSPVFAYLNASLQGLTTIRAFGAESILEKEFDNHQDLHSSAWFLFISTSRAFGFWLDLVCIIYITAVTLSFLLIGNEKFGGNVGLAITQSISLTGMFQWGMRQSTEVENQMTSVERVVEYSHIEHERDFDSPPGKKPHPEWPENGEIRFINLFLRYFPQDPPVLKNLNFTIKPLEKVGIVGRTGAGKSSMISALFQLTNTEGLIVIDGIDIKTIGLHDLRSKISIIPQEPVLFSGTMRKNLDPFDEYTDEVLWKALEEVELKEAVNDLVAGLNSIMSEGGSNFSVGQRQLVCLARAIIRNNKILVLDEATANVDPQTDALIQHTIRKKFANCTVLTIAHRLHTVMDSDKVMVMDAGKMIEFDHPHLLLQNEHGALFGMVEQTGTVMAEVLTKIAKDNYKQLHGLDSV
ncbi:hypothetical protein PPYR_04459 [Photinus pyralis]|uniref:Multidrug resistance-associated protein lethal(2)03659 n=1 Tax=Photinus pyralis TaxID=7054 RepID=A0A1Y1MZF9_PHOPY|nr:probable multidrug resistance-associated protein lethal(2)03659 isoform X2 [Photinus pyralis]KAB0802273.1 hypothetical protein PPYR_04459 [Photinus pyralis]